ncbi:unnamed protein product [Tuber aestivum]|uniref:Carboxypeptidase n=1 Tax=Tuber aestivum TaxID=59557 RepID=A0A292Q5T0_9PEZI|nr:unnamed protein product [Tuber aestivum]
MLQRLTIAILALTGIVSAMGPVDTIRQHPELAKRAQFETRNEPESEVNERRSKSKYYNSNTAKYWVNGNKIPDVNFDVGESYAGLMPISKDKNETRQLWFWFFPTTGTVDDELVIWLNGGPGCTVKAVLKDFYRKTDPSPGKRSPRPLPICLHKKLTRAGNRQYGTYKPSSRIDQPVGTGFSQGVPDATSEEDIAVKFLGFLENFIKTFGFENKKIYLTGESYAGYYVTYILDAMYNKNDTKLFDPRGLMIYNPTLSEWVVHEQIPMVPFVDYWARLLALNETTMDRLHDMADKCGYTSYLNENMLFPPRGPLPTPPHIFTPEECDVWRAALRAATLVNPCFNVYHITTTCPILWDVLGYPGTNHFLPEGAEIYFNRTDVQKAINAPHMNWEECSGDLVFPNGDPSDPPNYSLLPRLIDKLERTVIGHGILDFRFPINGTLLSIQNMTWGGKQGFQTKPTEPFIVPYDSQGIMGVVHTERKLTWVEIEWCGHMVPQYQPGVAYRQLEYLLGRIDKL